ncbi:MAG: hypothetical protein K2I04_04905, partial [Muribaculaceae bacterium]|nr:hypothetical protein [Muribaculaceae bacterium]
MNKIKDYLSRPQVWGFFVSVVVMAVIAVAFFYPDNFEGNSLRQPDMQQGAANGREAELFQQETGEKALWTNALFSGMPTFQISPSYPSNSLFTWLNTVYGLGLPVPSNLLFMMMFGFLILLYALGMRWYYALIGAVAWGFSSYFVIIIGAGHIWKFLALTYIPPTIAGLVMLYRGRYISGAAMLSLFAMLQLNANHPQMTYYFGLVMIILAVCYLVDAIRTRRLRRWALASVIALGAGALALGANSPSLYNTYMYAKETKRSTSELTPLPSAGSERSAERPTGGLPKSDIVGWSYGRSEMFSLIVPDIKGGASARPEGGKMVPMGLDRLDGAAQFAQTSPLLPYLSQYFNDSEGTNGPVYVGAIIFALFLLGCFIVKGPLKWGLIAATVISMLLALGYNAEWLTDWMIYNFPMYSKFRAVESILVVAEFAIPLLAVLALCRLVEAGTDAWKLYRRPILVAFCFPAAVSLAAALMPGIFGSAINDTDRYNIEQLQQHVADYASQSGYDAAQVSELIYHYSLSNPANVEAITTLRHGMVRADGWRSFFLLAAAAVVLGMFAAGRIRKPVAIAVIGLLIAGDLYTADKRYVSHSSFGPADSPDGAIVFTPDDIDRTILADAPDGHYRVLDLPGFFTADRSYFHKTLGGYHAAKLNRYEDLIQRKLMPMLQTGYFPDSPELDDPEVAEIAARLRTAYRVVDMLNARYVVTGDANAPVVRNRHALGNAWLVDSIVWVDNADSEMAALDAASLDFAHTAVADRRFAGALPEEAQSLAPGDTIYLTSYSPNELKYHVATVGGGTGVFSEVYFPWGWKASIDGVETPLARVNYVLRALSIPAGSQDIHLTFAPASLAPTTTVADVCVPLIYLL